jgi:hypothetical protein
MGKTKKSEEQWSMTVGGYEFDCLYASRKKAVTVSCTHLIPSKKTAAIGGSKPQALAFQLANELILEGKNLADGSKAEMKG